MKKILTSIFIFLFFITIFNVATQARVTSYGPGITAGNVENIQVTPTGGTADTLANIVSTAIKSPPSGFNWNFTSYPIYISGSGSSYSYSMPLETYASAALRGTQYFTDVNTGNDSNTGADWSNAFLSINKCITTGNATNNPYTCNVKAGTYTRANSFMGSGSSVYPTQNVAFVCHGGRCNVNTSDVLSWPGSKDATFTNSYKVSRSAVERVFDLTATDSYGNNKELIYRATATLADATPGSWAQVGSDLYVRRYDDQAVTNTNTRALLSVSMLKNTATVSILLTSDSPTSGFDLEGGKEGALASYAAMTGNILARNATFKYSGGQVIGNMNAVRIDLLNGLFACINCKASTATADGFNFHYSSGTGQTYVFMADSYGRDNGRTGSVSNNGLTGHETVIAIDVNGYYEGNYGCNVHFINSSKLWAIGTRSLNGMGDISYSGTRNPSQFCTQQTAKMWLDGTKAITGPGTSGTPYAYTTEDTSQILTRNSWYTGTNSSAVGSTISTY